MTHLGALVRIALRDLRGGLWSFVVFAAALLLGVAAVAAVGTVSTAVEDSVARDARALNGGDIVLKQRNSAIDPLVVDSVLAERTAFAETIRTNTYAKTVGGRRLVINLKAVSGDYPIAGAVGIAPRMRLDQALQDGGALAEAALLARLGIKVGDRLEVGETSIVVRGEITSEPDRVGGFVNIGPRLLVSMATLARANVLIEGALARYEYQFGLPGGADVAEAVASVTSAYPNARFRTVAYTDVQPRVRQLTSRLETYLTLAAVTALLTGGFAVGLAIQAHLSGKQRTIAAMRSQGATRAQILTIYSLQIACIIAAGTLCGLVLGFLIPWAGTAALDRLVPAELVIAPSAAALLPAAILGAVTAAIFAVLPLARATDMPASHLFRAYLGRGDHRLAKRWYGLLAALIGLLFLAVSVAVPQGNVALAVLAAIALIGVLLAGMGRIILALLRLGRRRLPVGFRTAAGSLTGPGNNSLAVVIGLGFGLAALIAIALIEANLVREIFDRLPARTPAILLVDIQKNQRDAVIKTLADEQDLTVLQVAPIVRARVVRIDGEPVDQITLPEEVRWTINSDRGLSYGDPGQDSMPLVAGSWWADGYRGDLLVSVEDEVARGYGVWIGDTISFNLAGRVIDATIANIRREIDWADGRLNFLFIVSRGLIEQAPQTIAMSLDMPSAREPGLMDALAEAHPNVTPINIRDIVDQLRGISIKLGHAIRGVASVTLLSGILVVAAAVQVSYRNRLRDIGVMRAIGATRAQARTMLLAEYGLMAAVASLPALAIGITGAWIVVRFVLDMQWSFAPFGVLAVLGAVLLVSLVSGAAMVTRLLGRDTASILRQS